MDTLSVFSLPKISVQVNGPNTATNKNYLLRLSSSAGVFTDKKDGYVWYRHQINSTFPRFHSVINVQVDDLPLSGYFAHDFKKFAGNMYMGLKGSYILRIEKSDLVEQGDWYTLKFCYLAKM